MKATVTRSVDVERTGRVMQLEGLFELPPTERSEKTWDVELPIDDEEWQIGLVVGPSGCGKSTIARELFGEELVDAWDWPDDKAVVDGFPESASLADDVVPLLSSVGFSSPPSWLRPFRCLSNGEQFRANLARTLVEKPELAVVDEFTSVVDRTVAKIGSAAVAKTVRRRGGRFVAVTCHYDVADWLDPDWIFDPAENAFQWRRERRGRPPVHVEILRVRRAAWQLFEHHHYLSSDLHRSAKCFLARVDGRPAAFSAWISFPHPKRPGWREHRTVCLPDFQGIGLGNALSEFAAGCMKAAVGDGPNPTKAILSTTSNPAMVRHRTRSPLWRMHRKPGRVPKPSARAKMRKTNSWTRLTAGFEYIGPARPRDARELGIC